MALFRERESALAPREVDETEYALQNRPTTEALMAAHAGEKASKSGTFVCQVCNEKVRVQQGETIPECPNGHSTYDERVDEPEKQEAVKGRRR